MIVMIAESYSATILILRSLVSKISQELLFQPQPPSPYHLSRLFRAPIAMGGCIANASASAVWVAVSENIDVDTQSPGTRGL